MAPFFVVVFCFVITVCVSVSVCFVRGAAAKNKKKKKPSFLLLKYQTHNFYTIGRCHWYIANSKQYTMGHDTKCNRKLSQQLWCRSYFVNAELFTHFTHNRNHMVICPIDWLPNISSDKSLSGGRSQRQQDKARGKRYECWELSVPQISEELSHWHRDGQWVITLTIQTKLEHSRTHCSIAPLVVKNYTRYLLVKSELLVANLRSLHFSTPLHFSW